LSIVDTLSHPSFADLSSGFNESSVIGTSLHLERLEDILGKKIIVCSFRNELDDVGDGSVVQVGVCKVGPERSIRSEVGESFHPDFRSVVGIDGKVVRGKTSSVS
jgi:hypothetical protein